LDFIVLAHWNNSHWVCRSTRVLHYATHVI
jgi:hypothetical protein